MERSTVSFGILALAALLLAQAAHAQIGTILGNPPPPVPPADVPNAPPSNNYGDHPPYYPSDNEPYYAPPPQSDTRADEPPPKPLPAPMNLPPEQRPGRGTIESRPLAPPLGVTPKEKASVPAQPQAAPAQLNANKGLVRTLPGLLPGQRQPRGTPQETNTPQQANPQASPTDEVILEPPPERISNPTAVFEGLDKITGRTTKFDVAINETVQFGALQVTPKVCYSRPPTETPQTDAFVDVDEVTLNSKIKRIFTGWMFAASPGLNAVEHPIYDVWLINCKGGKLPTLAEAPAGEEHASTERPNARAPVREPASHRPTAHTHQKSPGFLPPIR